MDVENQEKVLFTLACIDSFAKEHALSTKQAFAYLNRFKALNFIDQNFESNKNETPKAESEILLEVCKKNGGAL
ncbi:DUF3791 domain-containing protein [Fibrobacter sp. UWEL]|uniref:DUF3791 domain-containing protein n=1 Tax=Fibrobacter sp. UWEL TaxID=1896209 RepID=UPI000910671E|nr:DUF3791 domain-containing protein [Fibrobacter sp. UWEL]SHK91099.1 Protein of unknown function [Fibrobacter sp. UWEL]